MDSQRIDMMVDMMRELINSRYSRRNGIITARAHWVCTAYELIDKLDAERRELVMVPYSLEESRRYARTVELSVRAYRVASRLLFQEILPLP